jgi:hypothetical protein
MDERGWNRNSSKGRLLQYSVVMFNSFQGEIETPQGVNGRHSNVNASREWMMCSIRWTNSHAILSFKSKHDVSLIFSDLFFLSPIWLYPPSGTASWTCQPHSSSTSRALPFPFRFHTAVISRRAETCFKSMLFQERTHHLHIPPTVLFTLSLRSQLSASWK